jgi:ribosome-associated toxin RatA of RatAB toxin-antitoxin module
MKSLLLAKISLVVAILLLSLVVLAWVPMPGQSQTRASVSLLVEQSPERVWQLVSELDQAARYLPDVERIEMLTVANGGVGAARRLYLSGGDQVDETVIEWREGTDIALAIQREQKPPFPFADLRFEYNLKGLSAEATAVHLSLVYGPRYGLLGQVLDGLVLESRAEKKLMAIASALKKYSDGSGER